MAHDEQAGAFAMEFLDPAEYTVWKAELRVGHTILAFAAQVGKVGSLAMRGAFSNCATRMRIVEEVVRRRALFVRALFGPSLVSGLALSRGPEERQAFAGRLEEGLRMA